MPPWQIIFLQNGLQASMQPLSRLGFDLLRTFRDHLRPLIAYHLFFTLLSTALLLPAVAWSVRFVLAQFNRTVITLDELILLLFSPAGVLVILVALGLSFTVLYLQQAGMIQVAARPRDNHFRLAFEALWLSLRRLPALAGLVVMQVGSHLLLAVPFMLGIAWLYGAWLGDLEPYYVQRIRPAALWYFLATALPLIGLWLWLACWLYLRWILALPLVTLENLSPQAALKRSVWLTRGWQRSIGVAVFAVLALVILLPLLTTLLFDRFFTPLLWLLPERNAVLIPAMLVYLTGYLLITLAITFIGIAANALLSASLYLQLAHQKARPTPPPADAHPGRLAWMVELGVLLFAVSQAWLIINSFDIRDEVANIAHRGSSMVAPENTLAAVEQAIEDNATHVEIDVRLTADNEVVLHHDRSLQRLVGDPRNLSDLSLEQLSIFDMGSWFGDAFVGERIATLSEALATVRGRSALMIDMKPEPGNEIALLEAVIEALHDEAAIRLACHTQAPHMTRRRCGNPDVIEESRLAVMSPWVVEEIKRREPKLRVTLLAQLILLGTLDRRQFDALGLRHNRITETEIKLATQYGYEIHAWTVNDPARMSQLIDLGVDAIITDYPARLADLIAERRELSDGELLLVKLRNWLRH
ncbi:glycerophosphoryl diester phosphodiesterase membrane domain-containing protein [Halomonas sediminis]